MLSKRFDDLSFVIGLFFSVVGIILLLTHFFGPSDSVAGVKLNLVSGAVMTVFGSFMLVVWGTSNEDGPRGH